MRVQKVSWKLFVFMLLGLLAPVQRAAAQATGTVRGTVIDSASRQPVSGAQVQLVGTNRTTFTDASGVYTIAGVPAGSATLRVQRIGFAQRSVTVNVDPGSTASGDVVLYAVIPTLSQVVVVGYGSSNRTDVTGALTTVSASQIQTDSQYFASMVAQGLSVFVSSGDSGSQEGGITQVNYFASDPSVTAVGGTSLTLSSMSGIITSETAWNGSGGGISSFVARPFWQTGVGVPSGSTRLVPDVAAIWRNSRSCSWRSPAFLRGDIQLDRRRCHGLLASGR